TAGPSVLTRVRKASSSAREDADGARSGALEWTGSWLGAGVRPDRSLLIAEPFAARSKPRYKVASSANRRNGRRNASIGQQIVGVERLAGGGDPFRPRSGAPPAALVDRQLQRFDQVLHLVAGGRVRGISAWAVCRLVDFIERGQSAREKLTINDPLGKTINRAKAELLGKDIDSGSDQPLIARSQRRQEVAYDHPVGQAAIDQAALPARLTHHFGVVADAGHLEGGRIDDAEHIEIDEAVVKRGNQRIGHRMGQPHQVRIAARRVDDDEIVAALDRAHRFGEGAKFLRLDFIEPRGKTARHTIMPGMVELDVRARGPVTPVFNVMRKAALARIEVNR